MRGARGLILILTVASVGAARTAWAGDPPAAAAPQDANGKRAEELFQRGRALMLEAKFADACPLIEESNLLDPHVGTLLNLAACHEKMGRIATAWTEYSHAHTAARVEGQVDRAALAKQRLLVLEPRVPWLMISVRPGIVAQGFEVTLDGAPVQPALWGIEMAVDPGPHAVAVDKKPVERFDLKESEHRVVSVSAPVPPPPPPAPIETIPTGFDESRPELQSNPFERREPAVEPFDRDEAIIPLRGLDDDERPGFVFQAGFLLGPMNGDEGFATAGNADQLVWAGGPTNRHVSSQSCGSQGVRCTAHSSDAPVGAAPGLNLMAGWATSKDFMLGTRFIGARVFGGKYRTMIAGGPTVSGRLFGHVWLTGSAVIGAMWHDGAYIDSGDAAPAGALDERGTSSTGIALGPSLEAEVRLLTMPRGQVLFTGGAVALIGPTSPVSTGVMFPFGLSYRSR